MTVSQKRYLYLAVFFTGLATLAIEFSASRLLGNIFGTSNLVWASIVGLILIYLTAGYLVGGRWADRSPYLTTLYAIMAWGAFTAGIVPLIAHPVLRAAANAFDQLALGILFGSFSGVLILFCIPVTLLGMISPFAIRLAVSDKENSGKIAGQMYAISTLGSFIGTFLPTLLLIPLVGTTRTFLIISGALLLMALIGLWQTGGWGKVLRYLWMPVLLALLAIFGRGGTIKTTAGQIYETESAYNYIQVLQENGYRFLRLNEGQGVHSVWHPTELAYNGTWEQFLVAPFFNRGDGNGVYPPDRIKNMAIVGLAAGTIARQATAVFGPIPIDGYEIDPKIIEVGRKYFDMNEPNLNAIAQDGRWGLEHNQQKYSLIGIDAYRPPYIPWQLTTQEFFQTVRQHLSDDGAVAINVGRAPDDRRLVDGLVGTMRTVFPSVYVVDVPDSFNSIVYATLQPTTIQNLYANLLAFYTQKNVHPLLVHVMEVAVANLQPTPDSHVVYTDDLAPIELITNNLVLNFLIHGNAETVQ